jgi:hypothetical protein
MPYDPLSGLSDHDRAFLEAIQDKFLRARLAKVGPRTVQGHVIGKILADAEERGVSWQSLVASRLPITLDAARHGYRLTQADEEALRYSRLHAAHYVTELADQLRDQVGDTITRAVEERKAPMALAQELFHQFGEANHDWRRLALTETTIAVSNGYLTSLAGGTIVVGDSAEDACDWCREHLHNRAFKLLDTAPEPAEGAYYTEELSAGCVWPGKTNVGRSRHAVKSDGTARTHDELWHPAIPAHPHCRCRWRRLVESVEEVVPGSNLVRQRATLQF